MNSFRSLPVVVVRASADVGDVPRADAPGGGAESGTAVERAEPPSAAEPPRLAFLGALASGLLSADGAQSYEAPKCETLRAPFGPRYAARLGGLLAPPSEEPGATANERLAR